MIPDSLPPIAWVILIGILLSMITISHISRSMSSQPHYTAHAKVAPVEPKGWQVAVVKVDGTTVYLKEHVRGYSERRYLRAMKR